MSFTPPKYGDLGKVVNDLLNDDFSYKNKLTIKRKTASGLKVDTSTTFKGKGYSGQVKAVYKDKSIGELELVGSTTNEFTSKLKLSKLAEGVKATVKAALKGGKKSFGTTVNYAQENFAATVDLGLKDDKTGAVTVGAVVGFEGVSLGGQLKSKVSDTFAFGSPQLNMAFQIAEDDFSFGLATEHLEDNATGLLAKFHQSVSKTSERALLFAFPANTLTLVNKYALDDVTTLKTSVTTDGTVKTALKHTLAQPKVQLKLATEFATTNGFDLTAKKYGLGVTLGDF